MRLEALHHITMITADAQENVDYYGDVLGLALALAPRGAGNPRLRAKHPEIPVEHAIVGIQGARAYAPHGVSEQENALLAQTLGFNYQGAGAYRLDGDHRHVSWAYDAAPEA